MYGKPDNFGHFRRRTFWVVQLQWTLFLKKINLSIFQIQGKSTEQLRELFGMEDDFTEEQKQALREEYPWANMDDN